MQTSLEKDKIRFLFLEGIHESALSTLANSGYSNIECIDSSLPEDQLIAKLQGVHCLGIRSRSKITEQVLNAADKLIALGCFCIGTNQVDLLAASARGIPVFHAPFSNTRSVAELVIAESILLLRGVPEKNALAHRGIWKKSATNAHEIRGKVLGIIGHGNIGSQVSVLAESLGMHVRFYDVVTKLSLGNSHQVSSLDELLATSDIVSLHVPDTPGTRNMISKHEFTQMKKGGILINASRGTVVDIEALSEALASNQLLGAAVDVFPLEPQSNNEEFVSSLRQFDNCILTPHVGGSTVEAQANIGAEVAEKLVKYSDNGSTLSSVNFPEVTLPAHLGSHRILHIHENRPGVLAEINRFFSENHINISSQFLQTSDNVGYVVTDIDQEYSALALNHLQKVEGTIKTRLLF